MSNQQPLSFVSCPNPDHVNKEGWVSRQLCYVGDGVFKCASCGKEFTREEIRKLVEDEYYLMVRDLVRDYQQNLAKLYADKKENLDIVDAS